MATKSALVYLDGAVIRIAPAETWLKGGRDKMKITNDTDRTVIWEVPAGPFSAGGSFTRTIKPWKSSGAIQARKLGRRERFVYTVKEARRSGGRKKARKAQANSDPIIIIDI